MRDEMVRIECRNPAADQVISGIRFGALTTPEGRVLISEPMPMAAAERLCTLDGFALAIEHPAETLQDIDAEIAAAKASSGTSGLTADATREVGELQGANQAMAAELSAAHVRVAELERKVSTSRLKALEEENVKLAAELRILREGGPSEDVQRLTARIETLVTDLAAATTENKDLIKANKALAKGPKA